MLGIPDPSIWLAFIAMLAAALLCIVYGVVMWNRGDDSVSTTEAVDKVWAEEEKQIEEEF